MLKNDFENKGIYGYLKSKDKKRIDAVLDSSTTFEDGEEINNFIPDRKLAEVDDTVERVEGLSNAFSDKDKRSEYYFNSAREAIVPTDNERRRRRQFVLSRNVADDAIEDFYNDDVRPKFENQRLQAESEAAKIYKQNVAVPGANPLTSLGAARNAADPSKVMNRTMEALDNEQLNKIADAYARYGNLDTDSYRDEVLKPVLKKRMADEYINRGVPKNSVEYVTRNVFDNSLSGKLTNLALDGYSQSNTQRLLDNESMQRYGANRGEDFAAGVGALFLDSGMFAGLGGLSSQLTGKATSAIANNLTSRVLAKGATRGLTSETAKKIVDRTFLNTLSSRIATSGSTQGLTLGAYDVSNSVVDDLLYGDKIDSGKAVKAFSKGFGTGMALGVVGTPLKRKASGLTGGKKLAASAGVLSAESAVFTLGTEAEKMINGIEIEPIDLLADFGESTATLLAMRMAHWRPKRYLDKLSPDGHLKPELSFNSVERQEMKQAGINPDNFISEMEYVLRPRYSSLHGNARRNFIRDYEELISNDELSASTRAKLLYIVENKLTSTPPVPVECSVEMTNDGTLVTVTDNAGRKIERIPFATRSEADAFVDRNSGVLRRNRIATIENMFQRSVDSENFFRQAGEYARETGISVEEISNAMYKKAKKRSLNSREKNLIDDILQRSSYNDVELGNVMHDIRRSIEQRYGLRQGRLLTVIDKNSNECTSDENRALSDYENIMRRQTELMRSGVTDDMHGNAQRLIEEQGFRGYGNEQIKNYERAYETSASLRPQRGNINLNDYYKTYHPKEYKEILENGFPYPADGESSIPSSDSRNPSNGYLHSHDKLARMTVVARDMAKKLNSNIDFIYDPHQLQRDEPYYVNKLIGKGWYDSDLNKVTINLANNKNVEDVGFTVLHEVVGHKGLDNLFGEHYIQFLDEMLARATPEVIKNMKRYRNWGAKNDYEAMDEYLADMAMSTDKSQTERRILDRFTDFIGDALYRLRLPKIRDLNEDKIRMLMSQHRKAIENNMAAKKHRNSIFGSFRAAHKDYEIPDNRRLNENSYRSSLDDILSDEGILPTNKFRFIGEKGLKNLARSGNKDVNPYTLSVAKKYYKDGFGERDLKYWTGWELGADGKWRYEIDDSSLKVEYYPEKRLREEHPRLYNLFELIRDNGYDPRMANEGFKKRVNDLKKYYKQYKKEKPKFSDVVSDKLFFDAYPEYRDVSVIYKPLLNDICVYNPKKKIFYIDVNSLDSKELNEAVAVEMQKMIQRSEGFTQAYDIRSVLREKLFSRINRPIEDSDDVNFRRKIKFYDIEKNNRIREKYYEKYGFFPEDIPEDETLKEDYRLSTLINKKMAQSGNVETRNVKRRFYLPDYDRNRTLAAETEDFLRSNQIAPESKEDLKRMLKGPIDILNHVKLWNEKYDVNEKYLKDLEFLDPDRLLN